MPRRPRRSGLTAAVAAAALLVAVLPGTAAAQAGEAGSQTASAGQVSATLTWDGAEFGIKNARLKITRAGVIAFDNPIPEVLCDGCMVSVVGGDDVIVRDLDRDGEPEVIVQAYTGGAHCCVVMAVYDYRAGSGGYGKFVRNFLSAGYRLRDLGGDGRVEIDSLDVRFEDRYSSHAASFPPPRIFRYEHVEGVPRLRDVTRSFPSVIRKNAAEAKKHFRRLKPSNGFVDAGGVVSAYVADQYLLGRGSVGLRELDRQIARGLLGTRKQGRAFRKRLLRDLHRLGYR